MPKLVTVHNSSKDKEHPYQMICRKLLQRPGVDRRAMFLLCHILSRPKDWKASAIQLANHFDCGIKSIYSDFKYLTSIGHCFLEKITNEKGQIIEWVYHFYEDPQPLGQKGLVDKPLGQKGKVDDENIHSAVLDILHIRDRYNDLNLNHEISMKKEKDVIDAPLTTTNIPSSSKKTKPKPKKQDVYRQEDVSSEIWEVFRYWVSECGWSETKTLLSEKRRIRIEWALSLKGLEECKNAIRGITYSAHHMGKNDKNTEYNDIELIFRSIESFENFSKLSDKNKPKYKPLPTEPVMPREKIEPEAGTVELTKEQKEFAARCLANASSKLNVTNLQVKKRHGRIVSTKEEMLKAEEELRLHAMT